MFHPNGPTLFELVKATFSSVEKGYDLIASKFDYTPFRTPDFILSAIAPYIGKGKSIGAALDICCGTGAGIEMLRPICRDRVVGLDISRGLLDIARQRTAEANGDALLEFVHGNALDMSFNSEFDVAVCFSALSHIPRKDQPRFLNQVSNVLKPGGRFIFVTYYMPHFWSVRYWYYRGFNAAIHLRNLLVRPVFPANKLVFLLPEAKELLESHGFAVEVKEVFERKFAFLKLVVATKAF